MGRKGAKTQASDTNQREGHEIDPGDLAREEWPGLMLYREIAVRADRRLANRLKAARLRYADACIEISTLAQHGG